jgi:hypothetical protein
MGRILAYKTRILRIWIRETMDCCHLFYSRTAKHLTIRCVGSIIGRLFLVEFAWAETTGERLAVQRGIGQLLIFSIFPGPELE